MRPMEWLSIGRLEEHEAYGVVEYWRPKELGLSRQRSRQRMWRDCMKTAFQNMCMCIRRMPSSCHERQKKASR